jgi:hypothetical protein
MSDFISFEKKKEISIQQKKEELGERKFIQKI